MERIPRLTAQQRDDLVAYLDGELEEDATEQIERVLTRSPVARHEVEMLTRTWEMLDLLPHPQASQDFTERTMTTVRIDEARDRDLATAVAQWAGRARRWVITSVAAAGLGVAVVLGFLVTNRWIPEETELLVRDLPVIEKLNTDRDVGDTEFLEQLQQKNVLQELGESEDGQMTNDEARMSNQ